MSAALLRRVLLLLAAALTILCWPAAGAPAAGAGSPGDGPTVVTFTFDGTYKSQDRFARILAQHEMAGTFYVNSGYLGYPAYLTVDQLRSIARNRSEIGGASLYGNDLTAMSPDRARREICDDRTTLAQLGFQVTSFAYPRGAQSPSVKAAAQSCGYNSARRSTGLYVSPDECSSCPRSETLPPTDDFRIRTPAQAKTVRQLEEQVLGVERSGGGWLPLVFTKSCICPDDKTAAITPGEFAGFVTWLAGRPSSTIVRTVDQVMGGQLEPVHGRAVPRLVAHPSSAISRNEALSRASAWTVFGLGIGQAQIIFTGVLVSVAVVTTYRVATKEHRHAG